MLFVLAAKDSYSSSQQFRTHGQRVCRRYEASAPTRARAQYWDTQPGQEGAYGPNDVPYVQQDLNFIEKLSSTYCPRSGLVGIAMNNEPTVRWRSPMLC